MRGRRRVNDQRLGVADVRQEREELDAVDQLSPASRPPRMPKLMTPRIRRTYWSLRDGVARVALQTRGS